MKSKQQKLIIRIIAVVLAVLLAGSVLVTVLSATAGASSLQGELDGLKDDLTGIQQQIRDITAQINSLEFDRASALAQKKVLDDRISLNLLMIDNLNMQIEEYGRLILEKEDEVQECTLRENEQWEKYKVRVRAMEINGSISYYAILFGARDFSDLLSRFDIVSSIVDYDEALYDKLVRARQETEQAKVELEDTKAEAEASRQDLQEAQVELEQLQAEAEEFVRQIQTDLDAARDLYAQMEGREDNIRSEIARVEEEIRRANATVVGTGTFQWPVASNYITSGFGYRNTGIPGASTYHPGFDIAANYGTPIYAADSGTVLFSAYEQYGYGNYVTISHGNGYTTIYGHMSQRAVNAGQQVTKGQLIGYVGSTGISSGPHLHFEIRENGVAVTPLKFFSASNFQGDF